MNQHLPPSDKGWLMPTGPTGPPRMTKRQKDWIIRCVQASLAQIPDDRSCHTCDYLRGGGCAQNNHEEVPKEFLAQGCEEWKDDGVPF